MYYHLPIEVHLDTFKCLNFNQLFSVKQVNRYFLWFIGKYEGELARKFFKHMGPIELEGFYYQHKRENGQLDYKVLDLKELGRYVVHSPVDNELLEKWQFVIDKHIRLFAYSGNMIRPRMYHVLRLTEESRHLLLQLPPNPKNIEELQIIRFWLLQLFKCFFEEVQFTSAIFHPLLIKLLFDNDKTISTKFQTERALTPDVFALVPDIFKNNIVILESLKISLGGHYEQQQHDVLFHLFLNVRIPYVFLHHPMHNTLYKLIMNHIETSTDFHLMVDKFKFHYLNWRPFTVSERAENVEKKRFNGYGFTKYELSNIHNPNVKFLVQWIHVDNFDVRVQPCILIERMKGQEIKSLLDEYNLN
uniref:Uncharacterized protein n=1 Tax=Meloidogyne enterolobii TaxID=390850 RepID=A0A6V7VDL5_MELEN|nr:unnamed protein product [Meloidogyne enterolobii]